MFTKTSAIGHNSYFESTSESCPQDYLEKTITLVNSQVTSLHHYDKPVYLTAKSGISILIVAKSPAGAYKKFVLHGHVKIEPQTFFNLLSLSDESQVNLAYAPSVNLIEKQLEAPIIWKPLEVQLRIPTLYGFYFHSKEEDYRSKVEKHDFCELTIVKQGQLTTTVDGFDHHLSRYDAIIYASNQEHTQAITTGEKTTFLSILFDMDSSDSQFFNRVFHLGTNQFSKLETFIRISELEDYPYKYDQLLARLKLFILSLISEIQPTVTGVSAMKEKSDKKVFQEILDYIKDHPEARVIDVSKAFGLSRSNIQALFHRFIHMQPRAYMEAQRLNQAKVLIRESPHSLTEIAEMVGYHSLPAFSRSFKHAFGYPPSRYAKQPYKTI